MKKFVEQIIRQVAMWTAFALSAPLAIATEKPQQPKVTSAPVAKDFAGRPLPTIALELTNLGLPAEIPGVRPAVLPGWSYKEGGTVAGHDFGGDKKKVLWDSGLRIDDVYKNGKRVGLIRKLFPDLSWQVTEVYARSGNELTTEACDSREHLIPDEHMLIGIMHKHDPHYPPTPPRSTRADIAEYRKDAKGKLQPILPSRWCVGDTQLARIAALLNLITGKLSLYSAMPVSCVSPFFDPCLQD